MRVFQAAGHSYYVNPYDRVFKSLADTEQRGMLFLFAGVPIDADVEVLQLERELGPPAIFVDHLYEVRAPDGVRYVHLEFQNKVTPALPGRLLRYAIYRYLCDAAAPLDSILVLPVPHAAATRVPEHAQVKVGRLEMTYGYSVVRLWELDPALIFELNRPALLPLITLARASDRDLERAAEEIVRERNVDLASVFATLGGLRYDRKRLTDLLEKKMIKEFLTPELMRESSFLKPLIEEWEKESGEKGEARGEARGLAKGEARGLAKGEARGKVAEAQAFLRGIVAARFPGIAIPAKVETMDDIEKLHALAGQALAAASREQFQATLAALEA